MLDNWIKKSTKKSGVPLKVQDAATIASLKTLMKPRTSKQSRRRRG